MCQLLAMNSFKPARLDFSLAGFLRRGGETGEHADGWGAAFFGEEGCRHIIDEQASARSPLAQAVQQQAVSACNIIVHIRKATRGAVTSENCHPFVRKLWGREWAFAHNGTLEQVDASSTGHFRAVGQTDSELAFCSLLNALREEFGEQAPDLQAQVDCLDAVSAKLARHGSFNFVMSNGETLFARRATELSYVQRAYPFGCARLLDCAMNIDFARHNHLDDRMVIVATAPLTDEAWQPLPQGEVIAFQRGMAHTASPMQFAV